MSETLRPRIVIVGAGPAGIRAAATLVEAGLHPVVIDEGQRAGGQIYRRPPAGFTRTAQQLYGLEAAKADALHSLFDRLAAEGRLTHCAASSVIAVHERRLHVLGEGGVEVTIYDRLILATGASDRVAPVPGWQSAGVYSLGAAQIALKAQGVALGRRIVLIGSGPLLTLVGAQLVKAGADVAAVLDTSHWHQQMRGLLQLAARPFVALRGLALRARLGGRYHAGVTLERIEADGKGVTAMRWRDAGGRERLTPCDTIGMGWHLRAETHLADLVGCAFTYDEEWRQWLPKSDEMGRAGNGVLSCGRWGSSSGCGRRRDRWTSRGGGMPCRSRTSGALHDRRSAQARAARALCPRSGLRLSLAGSDGAGTPRRRGRLPLRERDCRSRTRERGFRRRRGQQGEIAVARRHGAMPGALLPVGCRRTRRGTSRLHT